MSTIENYNKQQIGYLIMVVIGAISAIGVYYLGKVHLDPTLIAILIATVGMIEKISYNWVRFNYKIPDEEPDPVIIVPEEEEKKEEI